MTESSAVSTATGGAVTETTLKKTSWRSWSDLVGRIGAEHGNAGAILGTTERYHVLPDMSSHNFSMLSSGVGEDPLNEIVTELVTRYVDKRNARTVGTTLANAIEIFLQKVITANLETFLDNLGGILIGTILSSKAEDVIDSAVSISWSTMFADVLNTPVAKLTVGDNINGAENFIDTRALILFEAVLKNILNDKATSLS